MAGNVTFVLITERKAMEVELRDAALFRERFMAIRRPRLVILSKAQRLT